MMKRILVFQLLVTLTCLSLDAQLIPSPRINPDLLKNHWDASWVSVPGTNPYGYGVYLFRNEIRLDQVPPDFLVHISADNRYKLFINGIQIGLGPARSDADNWVFDTYDLADYLKEGLNVLSAQVWNFGKYKPWAQISLFTGFIVQGDSEHSALANTPGTWKCYESKAFKPAITSREALGTFIIVGPGDKIDGKIYPWGWKESGYNDSDWLSPEVISAGAPKGVGTDITHALVPRTIPAMELKPIEQAVLRQQDNKILVEENIPLKNFIIPPHTKTSLILDQSFLVTAYPEICLSGGDAASLKLSYAETLFDEDGKKSNRNDIQGKHIRGYYDELFLDGKENRIYTSLWFRTFRYIQLDIETKDQALTINHIRPIFTAYPFEEKAYFESDRKDLNKIWNTGWRTSRLCANELYYDCPYYEQMQYVADTRVQALISLYVSGDDRLMRKAITDYYNSIIPEGLTLSRYPTEPRQVIPTFSLFWVSMIHDYLWNRPDFRFPAQYLTSIQHVLKWFEDRIDEETGMLGPLAYWPFVDWTSEWPWDNVKRIGGVPPGGKEGNSSIITLQYAMTLAQAADIFSYYGLSELASTYMAQSNTLIDSTFKLCWDEEKNLLSDTPDKNSYSQHANTFALLADAIPKSEQALFMEEVLRNKELIQASYYFKFYVNRAAIKAGLGNKYLEQLDPWFDMTDEGLSTFAEIADLSSTRSDCHAWSSSPLYEMLSCLAGITPAEPGFRSVLIAPHPGELAWIKAGIPHPWGNIEVDLKFGKDGSAKGVITLPEQLKGLFLWDHQTIDLVGGEQKIHIKSLNSRIPAN